MTTPADSPPALELRDIEMHYGFVRALDGIDMHVMPGEVVALLGDNGAGKSTLLKVMSGAHKPSHGSIHVHGVQPYWAIVATGALLLGSLMFERALQTAVSERLMSANLSVHAKQG